MTVVAIDGPAGAGKSTVARAVAGALGYVYLDTGAMYRALALTALEEGVDLHDDERLESLASSLDIDARAGRTLLNSVDVTDAIRAPEVSRAASEVSRHAGVRRVMVAKQREVGKESDVVMEGRDIGATVAPESPAKIYLTASLEERSLRRLGQRGGGNGEQLARMKESLSARDRADALRAESPLVRADGAHVIDSTGKKADEIVAEIVAVVKAALDASR